MLRSNLSDHSDAYIVLKQRASVTGTDNTNRRDKNQNFNNSKYLSIFCISLDLSLINWEIGLDLSWSKKCVISETSSTLEFTKKKSRRDNIQNWSRKLSGADAGF